MKLELKEYQLDAVHEILDGAENAMIRHRNNSKKLFAISLSSPTGSGKTIIMTSVIETILYGSEDFDPIPDATVLWVSDKPSLNEQTKRKMSMHSIHIKESQLRIVNHGFDQRTFDKGKIYFANTQILGKAGTTYHEQSDTRKYPIWETINNSVRESGEKIILIIDEAHRGVNSKGKTSGGTIFQQLMDGKEGNLPTPIVIGISATPERFIDSMMKDPTRTLEQVNVPTSEVKKSGLIKDKLVISHPETPMKESMTLLTSAIAKIKKFEKEWAEYTKEQNEPVVLPLLVIQVPSGCLDEFYEKILQKIKSEWPELPDDSVRNSMEGHSTLTVKDKHRVKYVSPPDIQDDVSVRVVLFKQALNTGWDCPRAEVMISFAVAEDPTYVAQTIGRMVRTPLARRVGTDNFLNTVSLYLPGFNRDAVEKVVTGLNEGEGGVTSEVVVDGIIIPRNSKIPQGVFDAIENLPSYSRTSKNLKKEVSRLNKMANLLSGSDIDKTANNQAKEVVKNTLDEHVQSIDDLEGKEKKIRYSNITTSEHSLIGDEDQSSTSSQVPKSIEDLNDLFREAKRVMPDDAAMTYWNALCEEEEE